MSQVKVTMPSDIDNGTASNNEVSLMSCAGISQLEKAIKLYIDNVIAFVADGQIEIARVKDAATVDGHTVETNVPANAKFTDTIYIHPTTSGYMHIPSGGSKGQILEWESDGTAKWASVSYNMVQKHINLSASSWENDTAPYIYTISDASILADSVVNINMDFDPTLEQIRAFSDAIIVSYQQADGMYKLKAYGVKPTIDLPIMLTIGG